MTKFDTNPFEDDSLDYCVLINEEQQYSLWPKFVDVPGGWSDVFGPASRTLCLEYIEREWRDMRPLSLVNSMNCDDK